MFGVPGHGKNEIDAVGCVLKISLRRAVSQGEFFPSMSCVEYLCEKFSDHTDPEYIITEIYSESLQKARKNARYTKYPKLKGHSSQRVLGFIPNSDKMKLAPYLYVSVEVYYGSCDLFESQHLESFTLNEPLLRDQVLEYDDNSDSDDEGDIDADYYTPGTIVALASDKHSSDPFYFVKIEEQCEAEFDHEDDYMNRIVQMTI